jgi:hypothetical protein
MVVEAREDDEPHLLVAMPIPDVFSIRREWPVCYIGGTVNIGWTAAALSELLEIPDKNRSSWAQYRWPNDSFIWVSRVTVIAL